MLAAVLTLILIVLVIRGVVAAVRKFMHWLNEGPRLRKLVDEGIIDGQLVESDDAAEMRAFVSACDQWERESRLGHAKHTDRPRLTAEQRLKVRRVEREVRKRYLETMHLGWFHIVTIFLVASALGLIIEEVYCFVVNGVTESRVGLVWGPFSPLYGFGAVFLTLICWNLERRGCKWWFIFLVGMLVGGVLEQVTGWGMETLLNASSWDYTGYPGAISKWVCAPYLFFWGALGLLWDKLIMPEVLFRIGMPSTVRQVVFVALLALYLSADIFMTVMCFGRMEARAQGIPASNSFEEWVDNHYTNAFIAGRFQNLVIGNDASLSEGV